MLKSGRKQLRMHQRCRYPDHDTNFTGFRGRFIAARICSTLSINPIQCRFPEGSDAQTKLYMPDQTAGFAAHLTLAVTVRPALISVSLLVGVAMGARADTVPLPFIQAVVVKAQPACRDALLVAGPSGYQLVEWLAGDVPSVGEVMKGVISP
jgi:hypothetical protein